MSSPSHPFAVALVTVPMLLVLGLPVPSSAQVFAGPCFGAGSAIVGTSGADLLNGGSGNDSINGLSGYDTLLGGAGDDTICGEDGYDMLDGDYRWVNGQFQDPGSYGPDLMDGGDGCDWVSGNKYSDSILGGGGTDKPPLYGGCQVGGPTYFGGGVSGESGSDNVYGNDGSDYISGGPGTDMGNAGIGYNYCATDLETALNCDQFVS